MTYYILPDQVAKFSHKLDLASKHLVKKPSVTFSEPRREKRITHTIVNNGWGIDGDGIGGHYRTVDYLEVVEVNIDDIEENGWTLVANVRYDEGLLELVDSSLFKNIPQGLGLAYKKCDYCGGTHSSRRLSHIVYNKETDKWMQIGSTCVRKMFGDAYITSFTVSLCKIVEEFFASSDWEGCFGHPQANHYMGQVICVDDILTAIRDFRKDNPIWRKTEYINRCKVAGTTQILNDWLDSNFVPKDEGFVAKVRDYVETLPSGEFNDVLKGAMSDGYIARCDIYKAFFACKSYQDSLVDLFPGMVVGEKISIINAVLLGISEVDDFYYGTSYLFTFKMGDMCFSKSVSCRYIMDNFKNEDGTYSFKAKIKWLNRNKGIVELGGRASKC